MDAFTVKELEKIKEYSGRISNSAMSYASAMSQKSFRFRDGSAPSRDQIERTFEEHAVSSSICRKAADMVGRLTWPATRYCTTKQGGIK